MHYRDSEVFIVVYILFPWQHHLFGVEASAGTPEKGLLDVFWRLTCTYICLQKILISLRCMAVNVRLEHDKVFRCTDWSVYHNVISHAAMG